MVDVVQENSNASVVLNVCPSHLSVIMKHTVQTAQMKKTVVSRCPSVLLRVTTLQSCLILFCVYVVTKLIFYKYNNGLRGSSGNYSCSRGIIIA